MLIKSQKVCSKCGNKLESITDFEMCSKCREYERKRYKTKKKNREVRNSAMSMFGIQRDK